MVHWLRNSFSDNNVCKLSIMPFINTHNTRTDTSRKLREEVEMLKLSHSVGSDTCLGQMV